MNSPPLLCRLCGKQSPCKELQPETGVSGLWLNNKIDRLKDLGKLMEVLRLAIKYFSGK